MKPFINEIFGNKTVLSSNFTLLSSKGIFPLSVSTFLVDGLKVCSVDKKLSKIDVKLSKVFKFSDC